MQQSTSSIVIVAKKGNPEAYPLLHQDLVEACKRGEQKAQFELYGLYAKAMYNTALRIVGDPDDAEDVMQEAFLKAFAKIRTYRGEVSVGAWIKRIVVNKALDFLRLKKDHVPLEEAGNLEEREDEVLQVDPACSADQIREAIGKLPEGYRIVLSLILLEGYDHDEVSQILNISNATSRTQYHRAKKKLVENLKKLKS
jgi:RNA polymerase sigma-70 factor (ECF subfamily)